MPEKKEKPAVLCDLGGVLIELNWVDSARSLFGKELDSAQLLERWLSLESIKVFEAGLCSFSEFYQAFNRENPTNLGEADFHREFLQIIGPVKTGCSEILLEIKQTFELALLSNTNHLHIELLRRQSPILEHFDHLFLSYQMHLVKPEKEIFAKVCEQLSREPGEIYFFDDSATNIEAAQNFGIHAFRVNSPQEISGILRELPRS